MSLEDWATRWNLPAQALHELQQVLAEDLRPPQVSAGSMSEAAVQQRALLEASHLGAILFRNNSGACMDDRGRMVRYGLANESKKLNTRMKSSDLIGVTPVIITQAMVGHRVGVFTAIETKPEGWTLRPSDKRGAAQAHFMNIVLVAGGIASFVNSDNQIKLIIDGWLSRQ